MRGVSVGLVDGGLSKFDSLQNCCIKYSKTESAAPPPPLRCACLRGLELHLTVK